MSFEHENGWYAIHTKTSQEDLAAFNIARMGLEVLNPKLKDEKMVWGVPKVVLKPLFPSYMFARFDPAKYLHLIQYARGVRQVLRCGVALLPVDEEIIAGIRCRLNAEGFAELQKAVPAAGSKVLIHEGAFSGLNGVFERELSDRKRVVLLLKIMGVSAQVVVDKHCMNSPV